MFGKQDKEIDNGVEKGAKILGELKNLNKKLGDILQGLVNEEDEKYNQELEDSKENFTLDIVEEERKFGKGFYFPDFDRFIYGTTIDSLICNYKRPYYPEPGRSPDFMIRESDVFDFKKPSKIYPDNSEIKELEEKLITNQKESLECIGDGRHYLDFYISCNKNSPKILAIKTVGGENIDLAFPTLELTELFYLKLKGMWEGKNEKV